MAYSENTYYRLRKTLDAFENLALNHCLSAKNDEEAQDRLNKFIKILVEARKKVYLLQGHSETQAQSMAIGNAECPQGLNQCDNDCVPYPCP